LAIECLHQFVQVRKKKLHCKSDSSDISIYDDHKPWSTYVYIKKNERFYANLYNRIEKYNYKSINEA
jgi:hypothetical protein